MNLENTISSLIGFYIGIPIFMFVVFHNMNGLRICTFVILSTGLTSLIKHLTEKSTISWLKRPQGARDCNTWMNDGDVGGAPGFPSGHVATSAAFWTAMYLISPIEYKYIVGIIGTTLTGSMIWSRMKKQCHTMFQTIVGAIVGIGVSYYGMNYT